MQASLTSFASRPAIDHIFAGLVTESEGMSRRMRDGLGSALGWPKIHQKSKMNLLPIPYGYLGIIDGIYVREIRIPSKSRPLKHPENGPKLNKVGFQRHWNNMLWGSLNWYL